MVISIPALTLPLGHFWVNPGLLDEQELEIQMIIPINKAILK
jgi:hypothetical protein